MANMKCSKCARISNIDFVKLFEDWQKSVHLQRPDLPQGEYLKYLTTPHLEVKCKHCGAMMEVKRDVEELRCLWRVSPDRDVIEAATFHNDLYPVEVWAIIQEEVERRGLSHAIRKNISSSDIRPKQT